MAPCSRPKLTDWRQGGTNQITDRADLPIYQGDTFVAMVDVDFTDGTPADLTGYSVASEIRRGPADLAPDVAATLTTVILLPNQISLSLTPEQTTLLPINETLSWDLELTAPDGVVTTVLSGNVIVTPEITRTVAAP